MTVTGGRLKTRQPPSATPEPPALRAGSLPIQETAADGIADFLGLEAGELGGRRRPLYGPRPIMKP